MLTLTALNEKFEDVGDIDYISLQWNRKWFEPGDYSVQVQADKYDPSWKYIICGNRYGAGGAWDIALVQKVERTEQLNGNFVQVSGYFAQKMLDDFTIPTTVYYRDERPEQVAYLLYKSCIDFLDNTKISHTEPWEVSDYSGSGDYISGQQTGGQLGEAIYSLLRPHGWSVASHFMYDYLSFCPAGGGTADTVFSAEMGSMTDLDEVTDDSNYKNFAVVMGLDDPSATYAANHGITRYYQNVDQRASTDEPLRILYVDARDIQWPEDVNNLTHLVYLQRLRRRGTEKLEEYNKIQSKEFKVNQHIAEYPSDFNIGDMCTIIDSRGNTQTSRLIEAHEVVEGNKWTVDFVFDNTVQSSYGASGISANTSQSIKEITPGYIGASRVECITASLSNRTRTRSLAGNWASVVIPLDTATAVPGNCFYEAWKDVLNGRNELSVYNLNHILVSGAVSIYQKTYAVSYTEEILAHIECVHSNGNIEHVSTAYRVLVGRVMQFSFPQRLVEVSNGDMFRISVNSGVALDFNPWDIGCWLTLQAVD